MKLSELSSRPPFPPLKDTLSTQQRQGFSFLLLVVGEHFLRSPLKKALKNQQLLEIRYCYRKLNLIETVTGTRTGTVP